jgi:nucleoporin POM152
VFNNSAPDQVAYHVRSLDSHGSEILTVPASLMKRPVGWQALKIAEDEDDSDETLTEIVARNKQLDLARLHSVRPSESLTVIPPDLASSESLLFITVTRPAVIALHSVTDKRGDRFNIAPHREAVVIECPTGGDFVDNGGKLILAPGKKTPAPEKRCIGVEEVVKFQARGVAPLKVAWKRSRNGIQVASGVVEGIDDETIEDAEGFRRERVSKTHTVPLRVQHDREGDVQITLTSVVDALGNTYVPSGSSSSLQFKVLPKSSASLVCPRPIQLLINGKTKLPLLVAGAEDPVDVSYTFTSSTGKVSKHKVKAANGETSIEVSQPGTFTLQDVHGLCPGNVLEPASCSVQIVPPPRAEISVTTLHECALDVGVTVNFEFSGSPPFNVDWTEQRKGGPLETRSQRFKERTGQIELRPDKEGEYVYQFTMLDDARYQNIPLNRQIKQVVHPPASVDIVGSTRALYACSGDEVEIGLQTTGKDPLKLMYRRSWAEHSEDITVPVRSGKQMLTVPVPDELKAGTGASGKLVITLVHVEDANGCVKRLPSRIVEVDIDRQRPTARFARTESVVLKDGANVDVPLRLTGRGPWEITYALDGVNQKAIRMRDSSAALRFANKGSYKIVSVVDANCPGDADDGVYSIDFKPRPTASLVESATIKRAGKVYRHVGMCAGDEDAAGVQFTGASPFDIAFKYGRETLSREHTLKSAQSVGILHLPSDPGLHKYQFKHVKDANYERTTVDFSLEVPVHARPAARFSRPNTLTLCRDSQLDTDAKIRLTGSAPFKLRLGLRAPASAEVQPHEIIVASNEWALTLPHEVLSDVGRYEVSILSVADSSGCDFVFEDDAMLSTTVEVVETARVVPVSHDEDLCVGDTLDFLLQGKAPWVVEYEWDRKRYTVTSSAARFSRVAENKGLFAIRSVALKDRAGNAQVSIAVCLASFSADTFSASAPYPLNAGSTPSPRSVSTRGWTSCARATSRPSSPSTSRAPRHSPSRTRAANTSTAARASWRRRWSRTSGRTATASRRRRPATMPSRASRTSSADTRRSTSARMCET